jgi:hypothetical protein
MSFLRHVYRLQGQARGSKYTFIEPRSEQSAHAFISAASSEKNVDNSLHSLEEKREVNEMQLLISPTSLTHNFINPQNCLQTREIQGLCGILSRRFVIITRRTEGPVSKMTVSGRLQKLHFSIHYTSENMRNIHLPGIITWERNTFQVHSHFADSFLHDSNHFRAVLRLSTSQKYLCSIALERTLFIHVYLRQILHIFFLSFHFHRFLFKYFNSYICIILTSKSYLSDVLADLVQNSTSVLISFNAFMYLMYFVDNYPLPSNARNFNFLAHFPS